MPIGPGKYDKLAERCIIETKAEAVVVIVFNGDRGSGMSMKIDIDTTQFEVAIRRLEILDKLPEVLRRVANSIEQDAKRISNS